MPAVISSVPVNPLSLRPLNVAPIIQHLVLDGAIMQNDHVLAKYALTCMNMCRTEVIHDCLHLTTEALQGKMEYIRGKHRNIFYQLAMDKIRANNISMKLFKNNIIPS